jgi:hypothetical protein
MLNNGRVSRGHVHGHISPVVGMSERVAKSISLRGILLETMEQHTLENRLGLHWRGKPALWKRHDKGCFFSGPAYFWLSTFGDLPMQLVAAAQARGSIYSSASYLQEQFDVSICMIEKSVCPLLIAVILQQRRERHRPSLYTSCTARHEVDLVGIRTV